MSISSEPSSFSIAVSSRPDETVVSLAGELDIATASVVEQTFADLRRSGVQRILLDLEGMTFMDSRGLRTLLCLRNDAERDRSVLRLTQPAEAAQQVFTLTGTRGLFDWT